MSKGKLRVAVLMGGPSSEYAISLATGKQILTALDKEKYHITPIIITKERRWLIPTPRYNLVTSTDADEATIDLVPRNEVEALEEIRSDRPDIAFIAMHGEFGEDGTLQGLLESIGLPYTGSGVLASALGMDKPRSLALLRDAGLYIPESFVADSAEWREAPDELSRRGEEAFGLPLVIKPANRGSSVGVSIARSTEDIDSGITEAFLHTNQIIIQRYMSGTEVSCGVLETGHGLVPLPPTEIIPKSSQFFDYQAKYTPAASEEITPARLPKETIAAIQAAALCAHHTISCSGMSRTDMIISPDGRPFILEINTIPGMSEVSLLPKAAAAMGVTFPELLDTIITAGMKNKKL